MALSHSPRIITDGLILCLDAGNTKSYDITTPVQAAIWTDLSGQGNNGTLVNGVGYSGGNLGSLVFDGSNYIELGINSTLKNIGSYATIECWFKSSAIGTSNYCIMLGWGDGNSYSSNFGIGNWGSFTYPESIFLGYGGNPYVAYVQGASSTYHDGNWHHAVAVIGPNNHGIYVDGEQKTLTYDTGSDSFSTLNIFGFSANTTVQIGQRPYGGGTGRFQGNIPTMRIYNRILTPSEIQQNFNATRGRYGI